MTEPLRVLVVTAHPDDAEFGCAGSVAVWIGEGADVTYCIVTDGSAGTADSALMGDQLAAIRREESIAAAKVVGVEKVEFLGYRDGYVEPTLELRRDIARVFRRVRPHRMVVMDAQPVLGGFFVNHPDHRAIGQACLDVMLLAGNNPSQFPELLDEGLEGWTGLKETYIQGPAGGETAVDITATIDRKIEALKCHASQITGDVEPMIRGWMKARGEPHGYEYAEAFHVLRPFGA